MLTPVPVTARRLESCREAVLPGTIEQIREVAAPLVAAMGSAGRAHHLITRYLLDDLTVLRRLAAQPVVV